MAELETNNFDKEKLSGGLQRLFFKSKTFDASVHAPKGGVTLKGKKFVGGQFVPKEGGYREELEKKQKAAPEKQQPQVSSSKKISSVPVTEHDSNLTTAMKSIQSMIQQNCHHENLKYTSAYDVVLKHGQYFSPAQLPAGIKKGTPKECYANAGRLALDNDNYTYVEGFALCKELGGFAFAHAWCVDKNGNVIDPTWGDRGTAYYGVPFTSDFLRKTILQTKVWGMFPEFPRNKYNPYVNGFPPNAFKKISEEGKEKTADSALISEEELSEIKSPEYRPLKLPESAMAALRKKLLRRGTTSDASVHAPKGGATIKGKKFRGGEFIPKEGGYQEAFLKQKEQGASVQKRSAEQIKQAQETSKKQIKGAEKKTKQALKKLGVKLTPFQKEKVTSILKNKEAVKLLKERGKKLQETKAEAPSPQEPAAIKRASFSDYKMNSYKNLTAITKKPLSSPPRVKGNLSPETAKAIVSNARTELEKYSNYLSTASYGLARDSIYGMESVLSDPSLLNINAEHIDRMMIDSIRKMVNQEVESNRQQFTDHGIRHIQGNIDRMDRMLDTVNEGKTSAMEKLMGYFIMINHDVGYTAPDIRKGGSEAAKASRNHKKWSVDILEKQRNEWNKDKIFSPEQYDRILGIVKTHDDTKIDKEDALGTSVRLADNLALFAKDKLPTMFSAIPKGKDMLIKMGEAAKNKDEAKFKEYRDSMYKSIDSAEMNTNLKRDLKSAVKEISYMTPHFTMGVLAGEISKIDGGKDHINVDIQYNQWDSFLQKYFDMGQYQTKKFLEDYGVKDFSKTTYDLGGFVTLRVKGYGTHDARTRDEEWYIAQAGGSSVEGPYKTKEEARMNLRYAETAFKTKKNPYGGGYITKNDEIIATKQQLIDMGYGWHWGMDSKTADAQFHAPRGGVTLKGKKFVGGQFIPKEGGYQEAYKKKMAGKKQPKAATPKKAYAKTIFKGKRFKEIDFEDRKYNLPKSKFKSSTILDSNFTDKSTLTGASFEDCRIDSTDFYTGKSKDLAFKGTKMSYVNFHSAFDLSNSVFENCKLEDCSINTSRTKGVTFKNVNFINVDFRPSSAAHMKFIDCDLTDLFCVVDDILDMQKKGTQFKGCTFEKQKLDDIIAGAKAIKDFQQELKHKYGSKIRFNVDEDLTDSVPLDHLKKAKDMTTAALLPVLKAGGGTTYVGMNSYDKNEINFSVENNKSELEWEWNTKKGEVHFELMVLEDKRKGTGLSLFKTMGREFKKAGVKKLSIDADISIGTYAWPRMGFEYRSKNQLTRVKNEINYFLRAIGKNTSENIKKVNAIKTAQQAALFDIGEKYTKKEVSKILDYDEGLYGGNDDVPDNLKMHVGKFVLLNTAGMAARMEMNL